jgi:hypothetical protein
MCSGVMYTGHSTQHCLQPQEQGVRIIEKVVIISLPMADGGNTSRQKSGFTAAGRSTIRLPGSLPCFSSHTEFFNPYPYVGPLKAFPRPTTVGLVQLYTNSGCWNRA